MEELMVQTADLQHCLRYTSLQYMEELMVRTADLQHCLRYTSLSTWRS
jgi:hypothetical protein